MAQINDFQAMTNDNFLPEHLKSYENLAQHFRAELDGLSSKEKGDLFEKFVQGLVLETDVGISFNLPVVRGRTGDGGVDLVAESKDGDGILYIQARLWVDRVDALDGIMRKFQEWYVTNHGASKEGQLSFLEADNTPVNFMLVTLSPLKTLISAYKKQKRSEDFYTEWANKRQLYMVDGQDILKILVAEFIKKHETPPKLILNLETPPIRKDNVLIGLISSTTLKELHAQVNNALFFENVRDFRGVSPEDRAGRTSPNKEMVKTITTQPHKMLEKNNGVVFKAKKIETDETSNQVILHEGSIVNGCQTTMCMVEYAKKPCFVVVKIVEAVDSNEQWEIAEAANYQNKINYIDLKLARSLRPQLFERAAAIAHRGVDREARSAFQIMNDIYSRRVTYDETRLLYIGLFSNKPNNVIATNYTELEYDLIYKVYEDDPYGQMVFEALFELQYLAQEGLEVAKDTFTQPEYAPTFRNFYNEGIQYRCFVTILALSGLFNLNIENREADLHKEYTRMKNLLEQIRTELPSRRDEFLLYYKLAVKIWMDTVTSSDISRDRIQRLMYIRTKQTNFTLLFRKLCTEADFYRSIT